MMRESRPANGDGFLGGAGAAALFGQLREGDRRRVLVDPAPFNIYLTDRDHTHLNTTNKDIVYLKYNKGAGKGALSQGQKDQLRAQLRSQQAPVEAQIQKLGGQVLTSYQAAYNGIKVQVRANRIAALARLPGVVGVHGVSTYTIDNTVSIPYIGAPSAWQDLGLTGEPWMIARAVPEPT